MEPARLKFLYNQCKPEEHLSVGDKRYIDLDAVRGMSWVARLARVVELSDEPSCQFFTGLPGSGKSTELQRLAQRLRNPAGANAHVVVVDAEKTVDINSPLDESTVMLVMLDQCERTLLEAEGMDVEAGMGSSYVNRVWTWLTQTDVELTSAEFSVAEVAKLTAELKTRPTLRQRFNQSIAVHFNRFLEEVREELDTFQTRAEQLGRNSIVIIFDSLEKLRGTNTSYEEVLQSAERVFAEESPLRSLPVHTLYTIPPALISRQRFADVAYIPMIKLHKHPDDGGGRHEEGFNAAMQLLLQRVPEQDLAEVFGEETNIRIDRLIEWSGGYPRELVRLLRQALLSPTLPLGGRDFDRILHEVSDANRKLVNADAFEWLAHVAVDCYLTHTDDEQRDTADTMLHHNLVLRYVNDRDWFDVHPSVREIPGVAAAIKALEERKQQP